ncbi:MAG TPA: hypothetical protein VJC37_03985 [Planctomycetota bacterium]|nr:hypothetical protein [Planctomycetota bacterium]
MSKRIRISLIIFTILFVVATSYWSWRWVLPKGKPLLGAVADSHGPYISPQGTNKIMIVCYEGMSGPFYTSIIYKHWLYGAREVANGYVWGARGEDIPQIIWDSETSFRLLDFCPTRETNPPVTIKVDLNK